MSQKDQEKKPVSDVTTDSLKDITVDAKEVTPTPKLQGPSAPVVEKQIIREVVREAAPSEVPNTDFLRNERVTVKYIRRENAYIKDKKHVGYGGLFNGSEISIPPPVMSNQKMKNLLTKEEKLGLEYLLGQDLSIYGPFWKTSFKQGSLFPIFLGKDDTTLDLSDPMQYILYKVLLASPVVANSLDQIREKVTYRFVLVAEGEQLQKDKDAVGNKVLAFEKYVEYKNNKQVLRYILRNLGKYTSKNQKIGFLQVETAKLIEVDPNLFVAITNDPLIKTKVLIEEAVEYGVLVSREKKFYDLDNNPISDGDTPTLEVAAGYLATPLGQEMRLTIEAKVKNARE